jgi:hypothetical protein
LYYEPGDNAVKRQAVKERLRECRTERALGETDKICDGEWRALKVEFCEQRSARRGDFRVQSRAVEICRNAKSRRSFAHQNQKESENDASHHGKRGTIAAT